MTIFARLRRLGYFRRGYRLGSPCMATVEETMTDTHQGSGAPPAHQELVDELRREAIGLREPSLYGACDGYAALLERAATALAGMGSDWERIAAYVATVALKAHMRGFSAAYETLSVPIDRDAQKREADLYIASGFDADTVRRFHPEGRLAGDRATVVRDLLELIVTDAHCYDDADRCHVCGLHTTEEEAIMARGETKTCRDVLADRYLSRETP